MPGNVYICYSHEDEEWKNELEKHLKVLTLQRGVDVWTDSCINGGENRDEAIRSAVDESSVAVLLLSADSIASDFIMDVVVPRLRARLASGRLRLLPLLIHPCSYQMVDWLRNMAIRPGSDQPLSGLSKAGAAKAMVALTQEIDKLLKNEADSATREKPGNRANNESLDFLRCDRAPQRHYFNYHFTSWFQSQRGLPQFYIIHGRKEDRPCSLVKRLGRIDLEIAVAWLKKKQQLDAEVATLFKEVEWPKTKAADRLNLELQYAKLINNLFEKFSDNEQCSFYPEQSWPGIFADFCANPVIAISHEITSWDEPTQALAMRYQNFWREVSDELRKRPKQPQFLILLHVHYPAAEQGAWWLSKLMARKTDGGESMSQALSKLEKELLDAGLRAQVLDKLTEVTVDDVDAWAKECGYSEMDDEFRKQIEKFFGRRTQLPMSEVEKWLKELCRKQSERASGFHNGAKQ